MQVMGPWKWGHGQMTSARLAVTRSNNSTYQIKITYILLLLGNRPIHKNVTLVTRPRKWFQSQMTSARLTCTSSNLSAYKR